MLKKIWSVKLARFATVGVFNTCLDLTILNTLVFVFGLPYILANLFSASTSMTVSYFLNHHIVFRKSKEEHSLAKFIHFFVVTGIGILGIQSLVIYGVTHLLKNDSNSITHSLHSIGLGLSARAFELNVGKILAVLVAMIWNFAIYHYVIFKTKEQAPDNDILL